SPGRVWGFVVDPDSVDFETLFLGDNDAAESVLRAMSLPPCPRNHNVAAWETPEDVFVPWVVNCDPQDLETLAAEIEALFTPLPQTPSQRDLVRDNDTYDDDDDDAQYLGPSTLANLRAAN